LGFNFAVHTAMLTGVAWAVPYVLYKKTKPSRVKAANRGLTLGLKSALAEVETHIAEGITQAGETRKTLLAELQKTTEATQPTTDRAPASDAVKRLLIS